MNNIVVTSNSFGYGPTGKAISILQELYRRGLTKNNKVYFIGSLFLMNIVPDIPGVIKIVLNERSNGELEDFLLSLDMNTICIGVQNRFLPVVCKKHGIYCHYIDGLIWLWKKIPESHLIADKVYWTRFPGFPKDNQSIPENVTVIEGIFETIKQNQLNPKDVLFNLGGCKNPLTKKLQQNYLILFIKVISQLDIKNITIATSKEAANFLKNYIAESNMQFKSKIEIDSYNHDELLFELSNSNVSITLGGQASTMETVFSNIPLGFYLPSNLSQVLQQKAYSFAEEKISKFSWEQLGYSDQKLLNLDEKSAIEFIDEISKNASENEVSQISKVLQKKIDILYKSNPTYTTLKKIMGKHGSKQIVDNVIKKLV